MSRILPSFDELLYIPQYKYVESCASEIETSASDGSINIFFYCVKDSSSTLLIKYSPGVLAPLVKGASGSNPQDVKPSKAQCPKQQEEFR